MTIKETTIYSGICDRCNIVIADESLFEDDVIHEMKMAKWITHTYDDKHYCPACWQEIELEFLREAVKVLKGESQATDSSSAPSEID